MTDSIFETTLYVGNVQNMDALFIELPVFQKHRDDYLDDDLFRSFQLELLKNPEAGDLIEDTGGLRKIRFGDQRRGKGKRSGLRVIYYWWSGFDQFWLFTVYNKNEQDDLTPAQKNFSEKHWIENSTREATMKRDIFSELMDGLEALADERQGKITLRTHKVQLPKLMPITAEEVVAIRQQLNLSRSVFAMYLRTNTRTLENWEQGRATPNAQATTLIRLVQRFPQTIEQLAALT